MTHLAIIAAAFTLGYLAGYATARPRRPYLFAAGRIPARVAQPQPAPEPTDYRAFYAAIQQYETRRQLFGGRRAA